MTAVAQVTSAKDAPSDGKRQELLRRPWRGIPLFWSVLVSRWKFRGCTSVGFLARVDGRVIVANGGSIHLGQRVRVRATHVPVELAAMPGGTLEIGTGTFINSGVSICAARSVTIGANCAIGNYSLIMDSDFHSVGDHTQPAEPAPVRIEDDVWLGARVTVLKGVTIGHGAVVAAGAVVTRDVAPLTVVGGVPARFIKRIQA
jgi:acetyltransferase-like isoleucine patch superfamily enzyme